MLNSHSRIHCGPEVKFFRDFYADYFNDPLSHLRFLSSARGLLPERELFHLLGQAFVALHEQAASKAGKPRWADKNPENVLYLADWRRLLSGRWLFIHVVRHPLDTLSSMKERSFPLSIPSSLQDRIDFYRRYLLAGATFGEANPNVYFRLHYERLVKSPETELRSLMEWLDETFEPAQLDFNSRIHSTGLEDPKIASTARIHSDSVGRWKQDLPVDESELILGQTQALWKMIDKDL
jgi:hypothetical protein